MKVYMGPYPEDGSDREIDVHIDDYDAWSIDSTLAYIIVPLLKKLRKNKHGSPPTDNEDVPKELQCPENFNEERDDVDDNFHKRWNYILDEMIWAFEQCTIDWQDQYHSGEIDIQFVPSEKENMVCLKKGDNHSLSIDLKGIKLHEDRMANGFRLFGKYYRGLWD